jgi:hypothetical protein
LGADEVSLEIYLQAVESGIGNLDEGGRAKLGR